MLTRRTFLAVAASSLAIGASQIEKNVARPQPSFHGWTIHMTALAATTIISPRVSYEGPSFVEIATPSTEITMGAGESVTFLCGPNGWERV